MILNTRNAMRNAIIFWLISFGFILYIQFRLMGIDNSSYVSAHEYSATEIIMPFKWFMKDKTEEQEISIVHGDTVQSSVQELDVIAEEIEAKIAKANEAQSIYNVPINTAPDIHSGEILEGEYITIDIDKVMLYVDAEYEDYDWDTKKRIKDIYILKEILVNQLNVSPTKASAIIGNICCEDSFAGLTNSKASLDNIDHANNVLGNGGRGYGCVQWTAAYRQRGLEDYYNEINTDLDWELTSVIAETAYLYNELYVSGIIGDLSEDGDLEDLTGTIACVYEAYAKSNEDWYKSNGRYKTYGCQRYTYAKNVYELICNEV